MKPLAIESATKLRTSIHKDAKAYYAKTRVKVEDDKHESDIKKGEKFHLLELRNKFYLFDTEGKDVYKFQIDKKTFDGLKKRHTPEDSGDTFVTIKPNDKATQVRLRSQGTIVTTLMDLTSIIDTANEDNKKNVMHWHLKFMGEYVKVSLVSSLHPTRPKAHDKAAYTFQAVKKTTINKALAKLGMKPHTQGEVMSKLGIDQKAKTAKTAVKKTVTSKPKKAPARSQLPDIGSKVKFWDGNQEVDAEVIEADGLDDFRIEVKEGQFAWTAIRVGLADIDGTKAAKEKPAKKKRVPKPIPLLKMNIARVGVRKQDPHMAMYTAKVGFSIEVQNGPANKYPHSFKEGEVFYMHKGPRNSEMYIPAMQAFAHLSEQQFKIISKAAKRKAAKKLNKAQMSEVMSDFQSRASHMVNLGVYSENMDFKKFTINVKNVRTARTAVWLTLRTDGLWGTDFSNMQGMSTTEILNYFG